MTNCNLKLDKNYAVANCDRLEMKMEVSIAEDKNLVIVENKDITKFKAQYPKLSVKTTTDFHDRFMIIDKAEVYHIGASIKDAGKKSFGITKIEDKDLIKNLINKMR